MAASAASASQRAFEVGSESRIRSSHLAAGRAGRGLAIGGERGARFLGRLHPTTAWSRSEGAIPLTPTNMGTTPEAAIGCEVHRALAGHRTRSLLVAVLILAGCAAPPFDATAVVKEWVSFMERDYVLRSGDKITVSVYQADDLTQEVVVAPNGIVHLKRLPEGLMAGGKTMGAFRREVQMEYAKILQTADVAVSLTQAAENTVYVAGEVDEPGPVPYVHGMTLAQAVAATGGLTHRAKWSDVRVLRYYGAKATNRTYRVNASAVLLDELPDFLVLPGDVIYCQTSTIADLNDIVELYIRGLLPFSLTGVSVGGN